jgi:hypothetical protein
MATRVAHSTDTDVAMTLFSIIRPKPRLRNSST